MSKKNSYKNLTNLLQWKRQQSGGVREVLDKINIKNQIVTIDAMGTQTAIAEKIRSKRADYVLALKANQTSLYEDVRLCFEDAQVLQEIRDTGNDRRTTERAQGQIEIREYFQADNIHCVLWRTKEAHGYLRSSLCPMKLLEDILKL